MGQSGAVAAGSRRRINPHIRRLARRPTHTDPRILASAFRAQRPVWSGRVLDPRDNSDKAIHQLNEKVIRDKRVESVLLTVRDGLNCIIKN